MYYRGLQNLLRVLLSYTGEGYRERKKSMIMCIASVKKIKQGEKLTIEVDTNPRID
jgi:hypothetical protein